MQNYNYTPSPSPFWSQPVGRTGVGKIVSGLSVAELGVIMTVLLLVPGANIQAMIALALVGLVGLGVGMTMTCAPQRAAA